MPRLEIVKLKIRRGTESQRQLVILEQGELSYTIDTNRLYVGDGITYGGHAIGASSFLATTSLTATKAQQYDFVVYNNSVYYLSGIDPSSENNYVALTPVPDNTTIICDANNRLQVVSVISSPSGCLVNTTSGYSINVDNETITIDDTNNYIKLKEGCISTEFLAPSAVTISKINSNIVKPYGGLIFDQINGISLNYDNATLRLSENKLTVIPPDEKPGTTTLVSLSTATLTATNTTTNSLTATNNIRTDQIVANDFYGVFHGSFEGVTNTNTIQPSKFVTKLPESDGAFGYGNFYILKNGLTKVTGKDSEGSLGVHLAGATVTFPRLNYYIPTLTQSVTADKVHIHGYTTFVVTNSADGRVYGSGKNDTYQLGQGNITEVSYFRLLPSLSAVTKLCTGTGNGASLSLLALDKNNKAWAWGYNGKYQFKHSNTSNVTTVTEITAIDPTYWTEQMPKTFIDIGVAGDNASSTVYLLPKDNTGEIIVGGDNTYGQTGVRVVNTSTNPTKMPTLVQVTNEKLVKVFTGGDSNTVGTWLLTESNKLLAAGINYQGMLGIGALSANNIVHTFTRVQNVSGEIVQIAHHNSYNRGTTYFLNSDGEMWVTGSNNVGQLGTGQSTSTYALTPIRIIPSDNSKIKKVSIAGPNGEYNYMSGAYLTETNRLFVTGNCENGRIGLPLAAAKYYTTWTEIPLPLDAIGTGIKDIKFTTSYSSKYGLTILLNNGEVLVSGYDSTSDYLLGVDYPPDVIWAPTYVRM